jgi:hypothetical protein
MIDFSIPLAAMDRVFSGLERTASRLAMASEPGTGADSVDLSAEMIALVEARHDFQVNANVLRTEEDVYQSVLSILG